MIVCPSCGTRNQDGEQFCGGCGSYLEWDQPQPAEEPAAATTAPPRTAPAARPVAGAALGSSAGTAAGPGGGAAVGSGPGPGGGAAVASGAGGGPAADPDARPAPPPVPDPDADPPPGREAAESRTAAHQAAATAPAGQPVAVKPGTPRSLPAPRPVPTPHDVAPQPGDLVCGRCGAGNAPTRRFCRACGASLADAPVAQRRSWWSRLWRPEPRAPRAAGSRPARRRRFPTRPVVAVLVVAALVVAGFALRPEIEQAWIAVVDRVQGNTAVNPVQVAASSERPDRPAGQVRDGATNLPWSPAAPGDGVGQFVDFAFSEPFRLTRLLVTAGASDVEKDFLEGSSPEVLTLTAVTSAGTQQTVEIPLDDRVGLQSASTAIDDVVALRLAISSTYRASPQTHVAIAEVEFRGRS